MLGLLGLAVTFGVRFLAHSCSEFVQFGNLNQLLQILNGFLILVSLLNIPLSRVFDCALSITTGFTLHCVAERKHFGAEFFKHSLLVSEAVALSVLLENLVALSTSMFALLGLGVREIERFLHSYGPKSLRLNWCTLLVLLYRVLPARNLRLV